MLILLTGCNTSPILSNEESTPNEFHLETASLETNTTNNDTESYETTAVATESIQIPDYSVGMLDVSLSFDELLVTYMDLYGIDSDEMARDLSIYPEYVSPDSRFVYIEDCQAFLP